MAEGDPGAVIDGRVNIVVAGPLASGCLGPAVDAVATAIRDTPELLDVQLDQLARVLALVADHDPARPVGVGEAAQVMAAQHPMDRRAGHGRW